MRAEAQSEVRALFFSAYTSAYKEGKALLFAFPLHTLSCLAQQFFALISSLYESACIEKESLFSPSLTLRHLPAPSCAFPLSLIKRGGGEGGRLLCALKETAAPVFTLASESVLCLRSFVEAHSFRKEGAERVSRLIVECATPLIAQTTSLLHVGSAEMRRTQEASLSLIKFFMKRS